MYKFAQLDGRWYCVANRKDRDEDSSGQVLVRWLTDQEVEAYREAQAAGLGELDTFLRVFPDERARQAKARGRSARAPAPAPAPGRFTQVDGAVFAVMNWSGQANGEDAAVLQALTPEQARSYQRGRATGERDSEIFRSLFEAGPKPTAEARQITIDVGALSKPQLLKLIELKLGANLPSLERSSREDLERLLLSLHG